MKIYGPGWEEVRFLGAGGQGKVFLVRSPESAKRRKEFLLTIRKGIRELHNPVMEPNEEAERATIDFISAIEAYRSQDEPAHFGALKLFEINGSGREAQKAMGRLESEIQALRQITHRSILKLLYSNFSSQQIVTEYHPNGTLATNRDKFRGNVRASLEAFRLLVEAVAILHERTPKTIHRDIKPENIFVGADGRLILGDFGIVFFQDETEERLTSTIGEKVGTHDWMAPWADLRERLDDPNPTFDVFPLGKILWWMISGKNSLPYWYHRKPNYDLELIYKNDPDMALVNRILDGCVVEEEKNCFLKDAKSLLAMVDDALEIVNRGGQLLEDGVYRPCSICGKGNYKREDREAHIDLTGRPLMAETFRCENCGHLEMFAAYR